MRDAEPDVAAHYTTGELTERAKAALREMSIDPDSATPQDLKAMDEFHTGGILATEHFFGHLDVPDDTKALDIGSGVGGTSRYMADRYGIDVTGVDLTPEFVSSLQRALSARGYYPGPITGGLDTATKSAVQRYQRDEGLNGKTLTVAAARKLGLIAVPRVDAT